jgi:hypothetical protein
MTFLLSLLRAVAAPEAHPGHDFTGWALIVLTGLLVVVVLIAVLCSGGPGPEARRLLRQLLGLAREVIRAWRDR